MKDRSSRNPRPVDDYSLSVTESSQSTTISAAAEIKALAAIKKNPRQFTRAIEKNPRQFTRLGVLRAYLRTDATIAERTENLELPLARAPKRPNAFDSDGGHL
jgi:hypothetical protein